MYSKIFQQIFKSSVASNTELRHIFMDLLVLADRNGKIDMTYESISAQIGVPFEKVVLAIKNLMGPDPSSRSSESNGARLVLLDDHRNWGWRVVNYRKYRNRQYDDGDKRRMQQRDYARRKRAADRARRQTSTDVDTRRQTSTRVDGASTEATHKIPNDNTLTCRRSVDGRPQAEAEAEAYKSPLPSPKGDSKPPGLIRDFEEAKALICKLILNGKDPGRLWSVDAYQNLLKHLPMPRLEVERVAWFRGLRNDGSPELEARKAITETGLMAFWGDEVTRANAYWLKLFGWQQKKQGAG